MTSPKIRAGLSPLRVPIYMKSLVVSLPPQNVGATAHQTHVCLSAQTVQNSFPDLFQPEVLSIYGLSCFLIQ